MQSPKLRLNETADELASQKSQVIHKYLVKNDVSVYKELCDLKERGWNSTVADKHFQRQRETADSACSRPKLQVVFYQLMIQIAKELDRETGVFSLTPQDDKPLRVLDPCIAPGAYADYILRKYPDAIIDGLTLPVESGGYEVLLSNVDLETQETRNVNITFTDVTLHPSFLPADSSIPTSYPDHTYFDSNPPLPPHLAPSLPSSLYDLIICDGQKLRTHEHSELRHWEPGRLMFSQLILALTHLKPGGTILLLHHKPEHWRTLSVVYKLSLFSEIKLYKPSMAHTTRSSFFIVAKDVKSDSKPARDWLEYMKRCWYKMTFGGPEGRGEDGDPADDLVVELVLERFGPEYIEMSKGIWERQKKGLTKATWMGSNWRRGRKLSNGGGS